MLCVLMADYEMSGNSIMKSISGSTFGSLAADCGMRLSKGESTVFGVVAGGCLGIGGFGATAGDAGLAD